MHVRLLCYQRGSDVRIEWSSKVGSSVKVLIVGIEISEMNL